MAKRNETLQALCRDYLGKLRYMGKKHGIDVDGLIKLNRQKKCEATQHEVELLSRAVDDERITRNEVPEILGKSYRQCVDENVFERIDTLKRQGIYSRISALLMAYKNKENK